MLQINARVYTIQVKLQLPLPISCPMLGIVQPQARRNYTKAAELYM